MSTLCNDWFWWLTSTDSAIRSAHRAPRERISACGHRRSLPLWLAKTVGMWGCSTSSQIMTVAGLDHDDRSHRNILDVTVYRWGLIFDTGRPLSGALFAWSKIYRHEDEHKGHSAWDLREKWRKDTGKSHPGILPIEAFLYHREVNTILRSVREDPARWALLREKDRIKAWHDLNLPVPRISTPYSSRP